MSTAVVRLARRLAARRIGSTTHGGTLDVLAVVAFTVTSWLALTVMGGTWMFYQRWHSPGVMTDPDMIANSMAYVALAGLAFVLLLVPLVGLGTAAARLGARGRARRLASLRLIGMTRSEVTRISLLETLVQAAVGMLVGSLLYAVTLPAWQLLSFQLTPVGPGEMLLPWWLWLLTLALLALIAGFSTVMGLARVNISPLGVARDENPARLKTWRLVMVVVVAVGFAVFAQLTSVTNMVSLLLTLGFLALVMGSVNLVGPWLLQLAARPAARTAQVGRLLAARRILDDPRAAWRSVAAVALLGFMAGFVVLMPAVTDGPDVAPVARAFGLDVQTGVAITLAIGLLLAATSTLINQAAAVFDRAPEAVSLDKLGMPRGVHAQARRQQVLVPLLLSLGTSVPLGLLASMALAPEGGGFPVVGTSTLVATVVLGVLMTVAAAEACGPLQNRVLDEQRRRND